MLPLVRLESAGDGMDAEFARVLAVARSFDLARPGESLQNCMRFADQAFALELTGENPQGWSYRALAGVERLMGVAGHVNCLGEQPDQRFTLGVLVPTYRDVIVADQPLVHRIAAVANNVFLSYRRLTVPIHAAPGKGRPSHILGLTQLEFAIPQIRSSTKTPSLSARERQCLSMAAGGLVTKQIAAELGVSEKTIEMHLARARHKLGARTTTQAVAISLAAAVANAAGIVH